MSGHSKWSTIKRKKAATDAKRGAAFTKLARMISVAAKQGGADPESNFKLRLAIDKARAANLPADNIERAIKRGAGLLEGEEMVELTYEGYGPGGAAILAEASTSNRQRTAADVKHIFSKNGGSLGEKGSVQWMFEQKGVCEIDIGGMDEAKIEETELAAIDAGAEDIRKENGLMVIFVPAAELKKFSEALEKAKIEISDIAIRQVAKDLAEVDAGTAEKVKTLVGELGDNDDVSEVYTNVRIAGEGGGDRTVSGSAND